MHLHILLTLLFFGVIAMTVTDVVLIQAYENHATEGAISGVRSYSSKIINNIADAGAVNSNTTSTLLQELDNAALFYDGRIILVNNKLVIITDTFDTEVGKTLISEEAIRCLEGTSNSYTSDTEQYVELTLPVTDSTTKDVIGVFIIRASLADIQETKHYLIQLSSIILSFVFLTLFVLALIFSYRLTRPLKRVIETIDHVSEGYLEDKVSMKGYYEIVKISDSFNVMLDKINKLEESRQEFVSNVSHELKTPMTSIKVLADSLLSQDSVPEELYREFLTDINDEIERENKIITDLLALVKLDKKSGEMHIAQVSINELLEITMRRLKPIAQKHNIELIFESFRNVIADVDEVKMSLALTNLIENAIKYNIEGGWVKVSLNSNHKYVFIRVSDSGIGIPEDEQEMIFERFYRVDKTRARATGGTGLGLAITKNVVLMHKGSIKVTSKENEGTTFTLRIPLSFSFNLRETV